MGIRMKTAVISGASGGIGLETAKLFAAKGYTVYNLSRSNPGTEGVIHISTDVSDEESVKKAFLQIERERGQIDILVSNAGFGISGAIEFTELQDAKRQFDVNFFGMFCCNKYAIPLLRKAKGRIINISSAAAVFAIPFQAFYSASKAAINSFTMAERNELHMFGISVCALMPGDVKTGFTNSREKCGDDSLYKNVISKSVETMEKDEQNGMEPLYIARCIYKLALKKKVKPLYTAGLQYKLFMGIEKITTKNFVNTLVGLLYVKK